MKIKVLGTSCPKCTEAERLVREAVAESGVDAQVEKISDMPAIAAYGVSGTPAVVVDGVVKSAGRIPSKADVIRWVRESPLT